MEEHPSHRDHHKKERKGYRVVFIAVFAAALLAEALLFMRAQFREIALILREDFRIVVVADEKGRRDPAAFEGRLRALPGTKEAAFISKAEVLKRLKEEAPDMVGAVMDIGSNPMPDTFEVELGEAALGNLNSWIEPAWKVPGVADIKYKPLEVYAILHTLFYGHYITAVLALVLLSLVLMALMTLTYKNTLSGLLESARRDRNWFFAGLAAALSAVALSYALVYPVKYLSPLWLWPGPFAQAAIVASGGVFAWVIFQWKNTQS